MSENILFMLIMTLSVFVSSLSQAMLKASANKEYPSRRKEYLNPLVIGAYLLFFASSFITVLAFRHVPLSLGPLFEALGYVFIAIIGYFVFKEKLGRRKTVGLVLIVIGICISTMPF
jgi:multidrug transporter EmrE-like cation transporter